MADGDHSSREPGALDPGARVLERADVAEALADPDRAPDGALDAVHRVEHSVPLSDGATVHVTETFTLRSWLRSPRRAVLNLTGPVTQGSTCWNIDVAGYDGGADQAARGFFAFAADYIGFGRSSCPLDGSHVRPLDQVVPMRTVLEYVRELRGVTAGIDLVVESIGGGIGTQLAADPALVRSLVLSTIMYTGMSETARPLLLGPEYRAFLEGWPDGYMVTDETYYSQFTVESPRPVADWLAATQPGRYPTGFFLRMFEGYPYYDPSIARAPGLVLIGPGDFVPPPGDAIALSRDYGKDGAALLELDGAGHVPRFEQPENASRYWREVFRFIDS